jgi:hypothetical protein
MCGSHYTEKEAGTAEAIKAKFKGQTTKAMIITGKRKKKYYDKQGKEINDKDTLDLIQQGANVISYHEQMPAGAKDTQYDKRNRRLIRGK